MKCSSARFADSKELSKGVGEEALGDWSSAVFWWSENAESGMDTLYTEIPPLIGI